jgi:hypothetical protein
MWPTKPQTSRRTMKGKVMKDGMDAFFFKTTGSPIPDYYRGGSV